MQNRLKLDFSLESAEERIEFINTYVVQFPDLTNSEASTIADYLLWGKTKEGVALGADAGLETRWTKPNEAESLDAVLENPALSNAQLYALNDAVITRGGYARLIKVDASVDDMKYNTFTADGIIIATPTGSTGYSLSAGGPIVQPGMNCMIITPVCPHSMQHCPCIVSEFSDIRLLLCSDRQQSAELQIDGQNMESLRAGDEIHIKGTEKKIRLIRLHPYDFFGLTRRKLTEWGS